MDYTILTTDDKRAMVTQSIVQLEREHYAATFKTAITMNEQERAQCVKDAATLAEMIARARAALAGLTDAPADTP